MTRTKYALLLGLAASSLILGVDNVAPTNGGRTDTEPVRLLESEDSLARRETSTGSFVPTSINGVVPLYQPTTITKPGHYMVVRNITAPDLDEPAIRIAASRVVLDLNELTLSNTSSVDPVVTVASGMADVEIRNGHILGGGGIEGDPTSIQLEHLKIHVQKSWAVDLSVNKAGIGAPQVRVLDCDIDGGDGRGVRVTFPAFVPVQFEILDNRVRALEFGVLLTNASLGRIIGNIVSVGSGERGLVLDGTGGGNILRSNVLRGNDPLRIETSDNLVIDNTLFGDDSDVHIGGDGNRIVGNVMSDDHRGILVTGSSNLIANNEVSESVSYGIRVSGSLNEIRDNQVSGGVFHAIRIGGSYNLVDGNYAAGTGGCGIVFLNDEGHAYRNNMLRGNEDGAICGPANTDAGGNVR